MSHRRGAPDAQLRDDLPHPFSQERSRQTRRLLFAAV